MKVPETQEDRKKDDWNESRVEEKLPAEALGFVGDRESSSVRSKVKR